MNKINIDYNTFIKFYNEGLNDCEISRIIKVSDSKIRTYRISLNLESNKKVYNNPISITDEQMEILVGSLLGDGHIRIPKKSKNPKITVTQSDKQKDYCLYKYNKLINLSNSFYETTRKTPDKRNGIYYKSCSFELKSNYELYKLYNLFMTNKKKVIKKSIEKYITPLSLAIWFMDDGKAASYGFYICSESFSKEENELLVNIINNKFDLELRVVKHRINRNRIFINSKSKEKFVNIIKPFIIKSMEYKLAYWKGDKFKALYKSCEFLENPEEDNQKPSIIEI